MAFHRNVPRLCMRSICDLNLFQLRRHTPLFTDINKSIYIISGNMIVITSSDVFLKTSQTILGGRVLPPRGPPGNFFLEG